MGFKLKDDALKATRVLPSAASTQVDGAAIALGHGAKGDFLAPVEFNVEAPALTTTMLPDTRTMSYSVIHSDNADLSSAVVLYPNVIVQTGAGAAGAAAVEQAIRLPVDVKANVGLRINSGASTTDSSARTATLRPLF
ncbi:hypothetical protein [Anatilimnocola floriformis]|uniref:hypothetical protein n=1 Tax=Anatilimnocola floriformis TaxID=2948575 RepID=UPI0020C276FA|nr:hypothetical protein [Anatilimnocola floriformis]